MHRATLLLLIATGLGAGCAAASAPEGAIEDLGPVAFAGPLIESEDLSAVVAVGERLLVASDEGAALQWLAPDGRGGFRVWGPPVGPLGGGGEADFEGLALAGDAVLALGSHSRVRPRLKRDDPVARNRKRLATIRTDPGRDRLYRLRMEPDAGRPIATEWIDLRGRIRADPVLAPFGEIPGKENGVDFEGVAAVGATLFVGCRSPVLRSGHVPVLVVDFDHPERHELRFVDLGGRGINDLASIDEGLLVLAGDEDESTLFLWDGRDDVPGTRGTASRVVRLGEIGRPGGGKPEGMAVTGRQGGTVELLVVYDGVEGGAPRRFRVGIKGGRVPKPG